jgi:transketolase
MRKEFALLVEQKALENAKSVFITGDLGFDAFENLRDSLKDRFINAGVAEQNMIGVAAGLAYKGFETFVYSIAPFAVYRCFEQIKIDVCHHKLPVYIVGNGGGYGYGIMGATHHAIEDIACLSALQNMTCWIPAFKEDVAYCLKAITENKRPAYLRLGLGKSFDYQNVSIADINTIVQSNKAKVTLIAMGPVVHNALAAIAEMDDVDLFTILKIPVLGLTNALKNSLATTQKIIVIEEHVERGPPHEHLLSVLAKNDIVYSKFISLHAKGYPNGLYGNQAYHQEQSQLDARSIKEQILKLI